MGPNRHRGELSAAGGSNNRCASTARSSAMDFAPNAAANFSPDAIANITTPVFFENKVFFTSNYGTGAALLGLTAEAGEIKAREIYFTREMQNHHGGVVLVNGYLYGFNNSILTCLEFATGRMMWRSVLPRLNR